MLTGWLCTADNRVMTQSVFKMLVAGQMRGAWLIAPLAMLLIPGCAGTASNSGRNMEVQIPKPGNEQISGREAGPHAARVKNSMFIEERLRSEVRQWIGTPYRYGGTSRKGIDCSGFVEMLYRDILICSIPGTTELQVKSGRAVSREKLHAGDLVFFRLPSNKHHVGIYLGRTEFAHASTSRGVTISDLNDRYWHDYFWTARRYLDE